MSFLKSIAMIGTGVLGVAAFMAAVVLCPFAFIKLSRRAVKPREESTLDGRLNISPGAWEALIPRSADLMTAA